MAKGKHREARALTKVEFKLSEVKEEGVRLLTTCGLAAYVDEAVVWPTRGSDGTAIEIQIDDLLSHLTEYWKPLALRQTYPLTLNPARPSLLRAEALQNWDALPEAQAVYEDEVIEAFRDCHDLSRCFAGYFDLPALWLIRSGRGDAHRHRRATRSGAVCGCDRCTERGRRLDRRSASPKPKMNAGTSSFALGGTAMLEMVFRS